MGHGANHNDVVGHKYDEWGNHYPAIKIWKIRSSTRTHRLTDRQTATEVFFTIIPSSVHVLSCLLQCLVLTTFHPPLLSHSNKGRSFIVSRNGLVLFKLLRLALSQKILKSKGGLEAWHSSHSISNFFPSHHRIAWQPVQEL